MSDAHGGLRLRSRNRHACFRRKTFDLRCFYALLSSVMLVAKQTGAAQEMALQTVLDRLTGGVPAPRDTPDEWVTAVRVLPARAASYGSFSADIDDRLRRALAARGIDQLYTHQAVAVDHALAGRNVVVTTPTASGKTLCYNAP